jgi:hypothetical protein
MPRGKPHSPLMTPAWREYWDNPSAPHPDAGRAVKPVEAKREPHPVGSGYFCHHYRAADEHWHHSEEELERCLR